MTSPENDASKLRQPPRPSFVFAGQNFLFEFRNLKPNSEPKLRMQSKLKQLHPILGLYGILWEQMGVNGNGWFLVGFTWDLDLSKTIEIQHPATL
ncbi:MAG: hypothetical protein COB46_06380 [Rhodospirillaceae bacterium]|nr:MAG: hypothetical protein COB46_06380 [Rhodospirillaceae bacterium]